MVRIFFVLGLFVVFSFTASFAHAQASLDLRGGATFPGGSIIPGYDSATCDGTIEGAIRYNSSASCAEFCDGSDWTCPNASTTEIIPDPFSFVYAADVDAGVTVSSDIVEITGISVGTPIKIFGEGSPQYRICSNATCSSVAHNWSSSDGTIDDGEYVQLRLTSTATLGEAYAAATIIGDVAAAWVVVTTSDECRGASAPTIGYLCGDGTVYAGLSPDGNAYMFTTPADAPGGSTYTWNAGNSANYVTTSRTSHSTGESNTAALIGIDSDSGTTGTQQHVAAQYCSDLVDYGHSDWYLPARDELLVLNTNRVAIGGFTSNYWSSSEAGNSTADNVNSGSGAGGAWKYSSLSVRCVRK